MAKPDQRSFDALDERRTPNNVELAILKFGDCAFTRITYFPGFRWTVDVKYPTPRRRGLVPPCSVVERMLCGDYYLAGEIPLSPEWPVI